MIDPSQLHGLVDTTAMLEEGIESEDIETIVKTILSCRKPDEVRRIIDGLRLGRHKQHLDLIAASRLRCLNKR